MRERMWTCVRAMEASAAYMQRSQGACECEGEGEGEPRTRLVVERDVEFGTTSEEKDALMAGRKSSRSVGRADRIAGIPAKASPFGLMARMSTHKARSRAGSPVREAEGIAGEDFFRAGTSRPSIPYRVACHLLFYRR